VPLLIESNKIGGNYIIRHIMTQTTQTVEVLSNPYEIINIARKGLPKQSADILSKAVGLTDREMVRILNLSERTFHRYQPETMFDTATTERLLQLAFIYRKGEEVFEDLSVFKSWMRQPHVLFNDKSPLDMLDTNTGFQLVQDEIGRIEYNVYI
jgi:putative toxin-antitoxin system antitoxin component (TIGR02293 family)